MGLAKPLISPLRLANRRRIERRQARLRQLDYTRWVQAHDTLTAEVLSALAGRLAGLPQRPTIGLAMVALGVDGGALRGSIDALLAQLYRQWSLRLVVDATAAAALAGPWAGEPRIELLGAAAHGTDDDAWRLALAQATAPWLGVLRPGDRLAPHALLLLAEAVGHHPAADVVYADHDLIDTRGRRHDPSFVCDWNPELLLAQPYLTPLTLYRGTRLRGVFGELVFDDRAAVPHELALRCTQGLDAAQVLHVPHVLLHAACPATASVPAVRRHLQRLGLRARVEDDALGGCSVRIEPPASHPLVTIVVPTRDRLDLLRRCVDSVLARTEGVAFDLLIVDNGSVESATLDYFDALAAQARVRVLRDDRPFNYSALNNAAVAAARGEYVLLLNNDTEVIAGDWLAAMLGLAALPGVGAVGARLWFDDGTLQHAGLVLGLGGVAGYAHRRLSRGAPGIQGRAHLLQGVSAVTAACLLVRRSLYLALGGLDETTFAVAYNDVDFCLRLRQAGCRNLWTPQAQLLHLESKSRGSDAAGRNRERFRREFDAMRERWGPRLQNDPAYNPNLTLDGPAFEMAWPPRVSLLQRWFEPQKA